MSRVNPEEGGGGFGFDEQPLQWQRTYQPDQFAVPAIVLSFLNPTAARRSFQYHETLPASVTTDHISTYERDEHADGWTVEPAPDSESGPRVTFSGRVAPGDELTTLIGIHPSAVRNGELESGSGAGTVEIDDHPPMLDMHGASGDDRNADEKTDDAALGADDVAAMQAAVEDLRAELSTYRSERIEYREDIDARVRSLRREQKDRHRVERESREQAISDLRDEVAALRDEVAALRDETAALLTFRERVEHAVQPDASADTDNR